jgi:DNA primase
MIPENIKNDILLTAKLDEVIADFISLKKDGKELIGECPFCHKNGKGKGIKVSPSKQVAKCFSCGEAIKTPVDYLMKVERKTYPEALKYLADKYNILTDAQEPIRKKPAKHFKSFRDEQLQLSGLTDEDQKVKIRIDDKTEEEINIYEKGTIDQYGEFSAVGDDMIIWYIGLDGKPVMFKKYGSNKLERFWRIRWQNPGNHPDKNGDPIKYQSPYKSGSHLYIPHIIRNIYNEGRQIPRLYLDEGEKKADKSCKHGMPSVGIMGIHNIGQNGRLPMELELIVKRCGIKEIVFRIDADWDELSEKLHPNKRIDARPYTFFCAVRNFRDYFRTFNNMGIYLELYFAHGNDKTHKGIDDLLESFVNSEAVIRADIDKAINEKDGIGEYLSVHKITTISDAQLMEFWHVQSASEFAARYKQQILDSGIKEFLIGKHRWRFGDQFKLELAQPLNDDEQFWKDNSWEDSKSGRVHESYQFMYARAYNFLRNRGFGRIMMASGQYQFCRIENRIVRIVEPYEIKDFVLELARQILPEKILDMLYRGGKMYFGPDSLGNIDFVRPLFELSGKDFQYLFFSDKYWKISADKIEENSMSNLEKYVWSDKIKDFNASLIGDPLVHIRMIDETFINELPEAHQEKIKPFIGKYDVAFSEDGDKCDFLQFLRNASDFYNKYEPDSKLVPEQLEHMAFEQKFETNMHLLSKLTAIGYLLHKYRNKSLEKAVIGMDGKLSEVGEGWGRSGKSLLGKAIGNVIPQVIINGKNKNLADDPFWAEEVTEKTDNIFIDDVRTNFDFEFLFTPITGSLTVNKKGQQKFTLSDEQTPKLYITTNHSINGDTPSFRARQFSIAFSDYYNEYHRPEHDFEKNFFTEWDYRQWNLFFNLCANALQIYFKYGLIESPNERLEKRRLRQFIGEDFMTWAHEYFGTCDDQSADEIYNADTMKEGHMNQKISRRDMFNDYIDKNPNNRKFITANRFKKRIVAFCDYMHLRFNPTCLDKENKPGADDKSGGIEFFTIANNKL